MNIEEIVMRTHSSFKGETVPGNQVLVAALGLCGESGEFSEHVKKHIEQGRELKADDLIKELGDVYYYLVLACMGLGVTKEQVVARLDQKLQARYPEGFSTQASEARDESVE